ncbi:MAG: FAD-dependent thymidylate synthase [candidate division Zixibacteria bacterium]|nr:FAD-dependent thymidylate synthase [candidate division Zixibacteria bacterium]
MEDKTTLIGTEVKVLDRGFVRLVDFMGSDDAIVEAARVSYGKGTKKRREDRGLIRYLMRHQHTTPFEMVEFKFHVKLPIFVARQWIRHRTANVNEYSGRYSVMEDEFYVPQPAEIKPQSTTNRQGREEGEIDPAVREAFIAFLNTSNRKLYDEYLKTIESGIAREIARINLPLSLYTQWYWKIDLHNLFHFLKLRLEETAQYEIREYAKAMAAMTKQVVPMAWEAFEDYQLNSAAFSSIELKLLFSKIGELDLSDDALDEAGLSKGEAREFRGKIEQIRKRL